MSRPITMLSLAALLRAYANNDELAIDDLLATMGPAERGRALRQACRVLVTYVERAPGGVALARSVLHERDSSRLLGDLLLAYADKDLVAIADVFDEMGTTERDGTLRLACRELVRHIERGPGGMSAWQKVWREVDSESEQ